MEKQRNRDAEDRRTKLQQPRVNHVVMPIGLRGTSELSWRKPWDGLRDEGQDAGTSLHAGRLVRRSLHPTPIVNCIEIHLLSLILPLSSHSYSIAALICQDVKTIDPIASSCRHVGAYRFPDQSCASTTCLSSNHCFAFSLVVANSRLVERYLFCPQG
jgi:hypothetical protein